MPLALTGYEIGLLAVAGVFIVFALIAALVVPRARPDFPAKRLGCSWPSASRSSWRR